MFLITHLNARIFMGRLLSILVEKLDGLREVDVLKYFRIISIITVEVKRIQ